LFKIAKTYKIFGRILSNNLIIRFLELTWLKTNFADRHQMVKFSITDKLILYVILISVGTSLIVSIVSYADAKNALINRTLEQLTSVRVVKSRQIYDFFEDRKSELNMFAKLLGDVNMQSSNLLIKDFVGYNKNIAGIEISPINQKLNTAGKFNLYEDHSNDELNIHLSKSYLIAGKAYNIDMLIDYSVINKVMLENSPNSGLGNSGESYIVGRDSLLRTTSRFKENSILKIKVNTEGVAKALRGESGTGLFDDYRGITVFSSFGKMEIQGLEWCLLAEIDYHEAIESINDIRNKIIFSTILLALMIFIVVFIFSKNITRPILELQKSTSKIAKGILKPIEIKHSNDEIGDLVNAFNTMIAELKSANVELALERQNRNTARLEAEENERERLSRELHDGLGQTLTALKLQIESFNYAALNEESVNKLKVLAGAVDLAIDDIRRISNNLMPSVLKEFGLAISLRYLVETLNVNSNLEIIFESDKLPKDIAKQTKINIYRIVQEALNNAIKHSGALKIFLSIRFQSDILVIAIKDMGKGFQTDLSSSVHGNGLQNMRERAESIGAAFEIQSSPGHGTNVILTIGKDKLNGQN
jgi:signal transduction histidine kinase